MSRSVTAVSRSASVASRSAIVVSTNARNASMPSGRLCRSVRGESITQRILRGDRRFENPLCGLNTRPIEPVEQSSELDRRQLHHPVHDRRPAERPLLQLLPDQHKPAGIPDQYLHTVASLAAPDDDHARERVFGQHLLRQSSKSMGTLAEINWPRGQQDACAGGNVDHVRDAEARTARNTAVNRAPSMPPATRTTAPASLTSMAGAADASGGAVSVTIGTKAHAAGLVVSRSVVGGSPRAACRHPKTCCGHTCQRRATSDTRAPGTSVSATIRAFSSADQRRRRAGPVRISIRRKPPFASTFASSVTSYIAIARSLLPQAKQASQHPQWKKGDRAPLTEKLRVPLHLLSGVAVFG